MARIEVNENTAPQQGGGKERAEKITEGDKICAILGHYFQQSYGNKYLCIGYVVIDDLQPEAEQSEVGIIHIDKMLIRDTVMWKHSNWASACGFSGGYDNEDHSDLTKIILGCTALKLWFKESNYTNRNGEETARMDVKNFFAIKDEMERDSDGNLILRAGLDKLITSAEQSFQKIVQHRLRSGEELDLPSPNLSPDNSDFDQIVSNESDDHIPF